MKNAVTINEMGMLLTKAVRKLSPIDRKRLSALLLEGLKTPVGGGLKNEIITTSRAAEMEGTLVVLKSLIPSGNPEERR